MYQFLLEAHSGLRYIVLITVLAAIIFSFAGWFGNKEFTTSNKRINLFALISTHLQFVLGLILYFVSPNVQVGNMGAAMKDDTLRYWTVEHAFIMLIAIVLITIGHAKSKRLVDSLAKHRTVAIFFTIALLLVIVGISMSGRPILGR